MTAKSELRSVLITCDFLDDQVIINDGSFAGKNYYIVPSIMLVEGAFTPAVSTFEDPVSLYFDGDDISESVHTWNGRPVSLYHPIGNTSCNVPYVLDGQLIGYVFNAMFDQVGNKLRADLWLDKDRGEFIVDKIRQGDKIELSVGAFGDIIHEKGNFNGTDYTQRMTNIVGDHLAVLPDVLGACSWSDGCGIRMNGEKELVNATRVVSRKPAYSGVESISWGDISKDLHEYIKAYYGQLKANKPEVLPSDVTELSSSAKDWIASKTLLGDSRAKTSDDLIFFPVVDPSTNKLNEGALRAVLSGRGAQAKISEGARASAQKMANRLLKSEFAKKETKMEEKKDKAEVNACNVVEAKEEKPQAPVTMQDVLATAPEELRGAIADAMREREEQRSALVVAINGYEKVKFCPNFLEKTETKELKAIASLVGEAIKEKAVERKVDYSLQAGMEVSDKKRCEAPSLF